MKKINLIILIVILLTVVSCNVQDDVETDVMEDLSQEEEMLIEEAASTEDLDKSLEELNILEK